MGWGIDGLLRHRVPQRRSPAASKPNHASNAVPGPSEQATTASWRPPLDWEEGGIVSRSISCVNRPTPNSTFAPAPVSPASFTNFVRICSASCGNPAILSWAKRLTSAGFGASGQEGLKRSIPRDKRLTSLRPCAASRSPVRRRFRYAIVVELI